jgi:hypothetical protein
LNHSLHHPHSEAAAGRLLDERSVGAMGDNAAAVRAISSASS